MFDHWKETQQTAGIFQPLHVSVLAAAIIVADGFDWHSSPSIIPMVTVESTVFTPKCGQLEVQEWQKEREAAATAATTWSPVSLNVRSPE